MHNILAPLLAAFVTALAAWLSQGLVAFTGVDAGRIGLLPASPLAIAIAVVAGLAAGLAVRRGVSAAPFSLLGLVFLPWLPIPLPAALLVWTGPIVTLLWLAVLLCLVAGARRHPLLPLARGPRTAAALAFVLGAVAFWQVSPQLPAGDEPHYLVITQSLLRDGDIRIENNHQRRDYRAYFAGDINPDFRVRGRDREIYSIHAPGVSALVAPAFAIGGYYGVVVFLLLLSAFGSALTWYLAWLVTGRHDAAWFGWAAVTLSATWIFHSFAVFPDGPGAVAVLTGVWALLRAEREIETRAERALPWLLHGAALAALPWMHTRFAALAGTLGALVLLRLGRVPNPLVKAGAFLTVPIVSAVCWIGFFIKIYGTPDPSAPYGGEPGSFAFVPDGLAGLFFDQGFGVLAYAPVLLAGLLGVGLMLGRTAWRRYATEFLFVAVPYLIVVTYVAMWWGGTSAPARFLVPLLPWLALPAAAAWTTMGRASRVAALGGLAFTAFATAVLVTVDDGQLAFNVKEEPARWLAWLNGSVDLGRGLPLWFRERETPLFRGILVWLLCGGAAWWGLRTLDGAPSLATRPRLATAAAFALVAAGSLALSITWAAEGVDGRSPGASQLETLRVLSREPKLLALHLAPSPRPIAPAAIPGLLRIEPAFATASGGAGRNDRPLFIVPAVPAGEYRLRFTLRESQGWLMLGIGRDQFSLRTEPLETMGGSAVLDFPVDVRAIMVRGDDAARRSVRGLTIEPIRTVPARERLTTEYARRAVRYAGAIAYFLDERSYPEPQGFWVGGARESAVVIQPETPRSAVTLLVRNGAAQNTVRMAAGKWGQEMTLAPGEERQVDVPLEASRGAGLVHFTTSAGFRPSDVDSKSRDSRFLGVFVKVL